MEKITVKIFIASASEMKEVRKECIIILNRINKNQPHLHLEPVEWEYDIPHGSFPDFSGVQNAINPLLKPCRLCVFVFNSKIGKYTKEEFELAARLKKKIFVFFQEGFSPKTREQLAQWSELLDFKEGMGATILPIDYGILIDFERSLTHNLNLYLSQEFPQQYLAEELEKIKVVQEEQAKEKRELDLRKQKETEEELQAQLKILADIERISTTDLMQAKELMDYRLSIERLADYIKDATRGHDAKTKLVETLKKKYSNTNYILRGVLDYFLFLSTNLSEYKEDFKKSLDKKIKQYIFDNENIKIWFFELMSLGKWDLKDNEDFLQIVLKNCKQKGGSLINKGFSVWGAVQFFDNSLKRPIFIMEHADLIIELISFLNKNITLDDYSLESEILLKDLAKVSMQSFVVFEVKANYQLSSNPKIILVPKSPKNINATMTIANIITSFIQQNPGFFYSYQVVSKPFLDEIRKRIPAQALSDGFNTVQLSNIFIDILGQFYFSNKSILDKWIEPNLEYFRKNIDEFKLKSIGLQL